MIHDAVLNLPCFSVDDYYISYYSSGSVGFVWRGRKFKLSDEELYSTVCFQMLRMMRGVVGTRFGLKRVVSYYCESPMHWHLVAGSSKPLHLWVEESDDAGIAIYCLPRDRRVGIYLDKHFRKWRLCDGVLADLAFRYCCIKLHFLGDDQDRRG